MAPVARAADVDVNGTFHAGGADATSAHYILQDSLGGDVSFGVHASARTELTGGWLASVNSPPIAQPITLLRPATTDTKVTVAKLLSIASDPDGDPFSFAGYESASAAGAAVVRDGAFLLYFHVPGVEFDWMNFRLSDSLGDSGAMQVVVRTREQDNLPSQNVLSVTYEGEVIIAKFVGIPRVAYRIQSSPSLTPATWTTLGQVTADAFGFLEFRDSTASGATRFYRTLSP